MAQKLTTRNLESFYYLYNVKVIVQGSGAKGAKVVNNITKID